MKFISFWVLIFFGLILFWNWNDKDRISTGFILNGKGSSGQYAIYHYDHNGKPTGNKPLITPSSSGFDQKIIAWPSAIRHKNKFFVYATGFDTSGHGRVGLWVFDHQWHLESKMMVLEALVDTENIGMSHVLYADGLFHIWYSVKTQEARLPREIRYGYSQDGVTWQRQGTVLKSDKPYEYFMTVDYVCHHQGIWHLFYSAFPDIETSVAASAQAKSLAGPWEKTGIMMSYDGLGTVLDQEGINGKNTLFIKDPKTILVGQGYILVEGKNQNSVSPVWVTGKNGNQVTLKHPLDFSFKKGSKILSVAKNKISPSFLYFDKGWKGIFTGHGADSNRLAEYTFHVEQAKGKTKLWHVDQKQKFPFFEAVSPHTNWSIENPEPIRHNGECHWQGKAR